MAFFTFPKLHFRSNSTLIRFSLLFEPLNKNPSIYQPYHFWTSLYFAKPGQTLQRRAKIHREESKYPDWLSFFKSFANTCVKNTWI
jgi:hypothetical protein